MRGVSGIASYGRLAQHMGHAARQPLEGLPQWAANPLRSPGSVQYSGVRSYD
ncbi:MAG: hypothetical protein ACOX27_03065 [Caldicoprobacterales bacterium]